MEGQQLSLTVATSFAISANSSTPSVWQEGLQLPNATRGSGSLSLVAGVGYLPAIQSAFSSMTSSYSPTVEPSRTPSGYSSFALSTLAPALSIYLLPLTSDENKTCEDASFQLIPPGGPLYDPRLGLLNNPPVSSYRLTTADIGLNSWAAWLAASWDVTIKKMVNAGQVTGLPKGSSWASVASTADEWRKAAVTQLISDAVRSRQLPPNGFGLPYDDFFTLGWVR